MYSVDSLLSGRESISRGELYYKLKETNPKLAKGIAGHIFTDYTFKRVMWRLFLSISLISACLFIYNVNVKGVLALRGIVHLPLSITHGLRCLFDARSNDRFLAKKFTRKELEDKLISMGMKLPKSCVEMKPIRTR